MTLSSLSSPNAKGIHPEVGAHIIQLERDATVDLESGLTRHASRDEKLNQQSNPLTSPQNHVTNTSNSTSPATHAIGHNPSTISLASLPPHFVYPPPPAGLHNVPKDDVDEQNSEPEDHKLQLDQRMEFWEAYIQEANKQDKEIVGGLGADLDTHLIFAGLFSAVNASVIIESYKEMREDSSNTTNQLLWAIIRNANVDGEFQMSPFTSTPRAIRINGFLFASLSCSLFAAFGAVLAKQWLAHFDREGRTMSPSEKGRERQQKYMGFEKWKVEKVIETLPTILQFSLFFFFVGLADFIWEFNTVVAGIVVGFAAFTFIFYAITTVIASAAAGSPFQTRFSAILSKLLQRSKSSAHRGEDVIGGECVRWLLQSSSGATARAATAIFSLSDPVRKRVGLSTARAIECLLRPVIIGQTVMLGISFDRLRSSLGALYQMLSEWNPTKDPVFPHSLPADTWLIECVQRELWRINRIFPPEGDVEPLQWIARIMLKFGLDTIQHASDINLLYKNILHNTVPVGEALTEGRTFTDIIGSIICSPVPFSLKQLDGFLSLDSGYTRRELSKLDPLVAVPQTDDGHIAFAHPSIITFLTTIELCPDPKFYIDEEEHHRNLAMKCFEHMESSLKPDICEFKYPFNEIVNLTIDPLDPRVKSGVSTQLNFACKHWALYLSLTTPSSPNHPLVSSLRTHLKSNCLSWIEVLGLVGGLEAALESLKLAEKWWKLITPPPPDSKDIITVCREARLIISGMMSLLNNSVVHPMQISHNAIHFIPNGIFFSHYKQEIPINRRSLRSHLSWAGFSKLVMGHPNLVYGITFSPDNTRIATSSRDNFIRIWDTSSGELISTLEGHTHWTYSIAYSQDGSLIATGARDKTIRIWDALSTAMLHTFAGHSQWIFSLAFSPDKSRIASGSADNVVRVWDIKSNTQIHTLIGHTGVVWCLTFANDGALLVSGSQDGTARVWDVETGDCLHSLVGHSDVISSVSCSPDGLTIATGSGDKVLKLWDAASGTHIQDLNDPSNWTAQLAFAPEPSETSIASYADKRIVQFLGEGEDEDSDGDGASGDGDSDDHLSTRTESIIVSGNGIGQHEEEES